jgi:diaminopimelate decarboxylase
LHAPAVLRRWEIYRKSFPMTEIALPACVLRDHIVARWARHHGLAVDVRSGEELAVAIAAGIEQMRLTVHADGMSDSDLRAAVQLAPGRVVVSSTAQVEVLARVVDHRTQGIVVVVTDNDARAQMVAGAILTGERFNLVGLHCDVGLHEHDFVSYPAAIGRMIAEMDQIRRHHGVVLTRLGLGGSGAVSSGDSATDLAEVASQIDESLDDACATLRYPRPLVVLSPGLAIVDQNAA